MSRKIFFIFAFMFLIAAGIASATISGQLSTLLIKPEKNFTVGEIGYVSLHVVTLGSIPTAFTASITLTGGSTNQSSFSVSDTTGSCSVFLCVYDGLFGFTVTGTGPFSYGATITETSTGNSITENANGNAGVDTDGDNYYSTASGGNDCDDININVYPGAAEVCGDGIDQDCDGSDAGCPAPSGSNTGGGSSHGGRTAGALTATVYDCSKGNVSVGKSDKIIVNYEGTNYTFFVNDVLASGLQVKLYPIPSRDFTLEEGKSKEIDLDRNNRNDFTIRIEDVKSGKATVTCRSTTEIGAPVEKKEEKKETIVEQVEEVATNVKEGILKIVSEVVPKKKASPITGSLIALAIVVAGLLLYYLMRKGREEEEEF